VTMARSCTRGTLVCKALRRPQSHPFALVQHDTQNSFHRLKQARNPNFHPQRAGYGGLPTSVVHHQSLCPRQNAPKHTQGSNHCCSIGMRRRNSISKLRSYHSIFCRPSSPRTECFLCPDLGAMRFKQVTSGVIGWMNVQNETVTPVFSSRVPKLSA